MLISDCSSTARMFLSRSSAMIPRRRSGLRRVVRFLSQPLVSCHLIVILRVAGVGRLNDWVRSLVPFEEVVPAITVPESGAGCNLESINAESLANDVEPVVSHEADRSTRKELPLTLFQPSLQVDLNKNGSVPLEGLPSSHSDKVIVTHILQGNLSRNP